MTNPIQSDMANLSYDIMQFLDTKRKAKLFCGVYLNILKDIDTYGIQTPNGIDGIVPALANFQRNHVKFRQEFLRTAENIFDFTTDESECEWLFRSMINFCRSKNDDVEYETGNIEYAIDYASISLSMIRSYSIEEAFAVIRSWMIEMEPVLS